MDALRAALADQSLVAVSSKVDQITLNLAREKGGVARNPVGTRKK